eukprot:2324332-Amphidinium_carterae.1
MAVNSRVASATMQSEQFKMKTVPLSRHRALEPNVVSKTLWFSTQCPICRTARNVLRKRSRPMANLSVASLPCLGYDLLQDSMVGSAKDVLAKHNITQSDIDFHVGDVQTSDFQRAVDTQSSAKRRRQNPRPGILTKRFACLQKVITVPTIPIT